ncbi:MAG: DUF4838 domain-containing protein [Lentisphaerae bacterium]|nr:DUF4838 domain-containing protein [Lentisphaerota bacterium]
MKKILLISGAVLMTVAASAFELGKKAVNIYYNRINTRPAMEMSQLLGKVFGKKFKAVQLKNADFKNPGIYIGFEAPGVKYTLPADKKEFVATHADESKVFIWGNDKENLKGTLFAVADFLEKYAGVRFLWPGELGTVAEKRKPVKIKNGLDLYIPPFDLRLTSSFHYGSRNRTVQENLNLDNWLNHQKVGKSIRAHRGSGFQHAFEDLMPREVYGKEHPEYYALVSPEKWIGEPKPDKPTRLSDPTMPGPWQLCTSNPDVRRIIAEKLAAAKSDGIQSISPNDGYGFCECANCKAQDGLDAKRHGRYFALTNRMYNFAEDIAKQVKKLNPKAKVGMFAYSFYDGVPDGKIEFPGNMYLSYCYMVYDAKDKAAEDEINNKILGLAASGAKVIGREYWGTHYTMEYPLSHSRKIDRNIKTLRKGNAAGIYGETGASFGPRATDLYILAKLSWNPDLKREDILMDFCISAFGNDAAPVMFEMFEKIEDHVEKGFAVDPYLACPNYKFYGNSYSKNNYVMARIFDHNFTKMCNDYFHKAAKLVKTPAQKARLQYIKNGVNFARVTSDALCAYQDLAAIGLNMPLTMPSNLNIPMEKNAVLKVVNDALKAYNEKEFYINRYSLDSNIGRARRSNAINLRPWGTLAEIARIDIISEKFNYLVNGAFEYSSYSWDVKALKGNAGAAFVTSANCDADNNYMVTSHALQGISLELSMDKDAVAEIKQLRPIAAKENMEARFRMFVKSASGDPAKYLKVRFGEQTFDMVTVVDESRANGDWYELRSQVLPVAPGTYEFRIEVSNPAGLFGGDSLTLNFDELRLRLKSVNRITK